MGIEEEIEARRITEEAAGQSEEQLVTQEFLNELEAEMFDAAEKLEFERAAKLRDKILQVKAQLAGTSVASSDGRLQPQTKGRSKRRKSNSPRPSKGWKGS